jgi:predicted lipoprotein with Yx(FWY)xxD motif
MFRARHVVTGIAMALVLATPVAAQTAGTLRIGQKADLGRFVVDSAGKSLYEFKRDAGTTSACVDNCLVTWPPLVQASGNPTLAPGLGGTVGVAVQADGRRQVTYNGKLLYYYRTDAAAGDTNGQGVGGNWFVVEAVAGASLLPATGGMAGIPVHSGLLAGAAGAIALGAGAVLRRLGRRRA